MLDKSYDQTGARKSIALQIINKTDRIQATHWNRAQSREMELTRKMTTGWLA